MSLSDSLRNEVEAIFKAQWQKRTGRVVPEPEDLALGNEAVEFDRASILYADLSGSTALVEGRSWTEAAEIYKTYLLCAAKLIRDAGGAITSYDGDRVMGVFIGNSQSTTAVRCALKIHYALSNIVQPALLNQYPSIGYSMKHKVGIDTSPIRAARTGVRGGNDIVWVGRAANYAAKLTEFKEAPSTWITADVFNQLADPFAGVFKAVMWKSWTWNAQGNIRIYSTTYHQSF
jgi:class 3 adenylate cyclase